ncbi:hypothetical protein GCM10020295_05480 [Streptomyces cinereospinus]
MAVGVRAAPRRGPGPCRGGGGAAWRTFTGYTHGILLVAVTNAVLVGLALFALGVPLAVPLALLEFFAAFVPLIGSPIALAVAAVVALASKGPLIALVVVALIVVIGQIEGHVLHPLVMSWAVRLHPVVVALSVVGGAVAAGGDRRGGGRTAGRRGVVGAPGAAAAPGRRGRARSARRRAVADAPGRPAGPGGDCRGPDPDGLLVPPRSRQTTVTGCRTTASKR